ncbi:hypothetical protein ABIE69_003631, partial [Rhodobacteraceae bacterium MBR-64]
GQGKGKCRSVSSADYATAERDWESYVRRGTLALLFNSLFVTGSGLQFLTIASCVLVMTLFLHYLIQRQDIKILRLLLNGRWK